MPLIQSRPIPSNPLQAAFAIGEIVHFCPGNYSPSRWCTTIAFAAEVVSISFTDSKVLYDLALQNDDGTFHHDNPIMRVDSFLIRRLP